MAKIISLTEIKEDSFSTNLKRNRFSLNEVVINVDHIVFARRDKDFKERIIKNDEWPRDLDERVEFAKIFLAGNSHSSTLMIVGDIDLIKDKINEE